MTLKSKYKIPSLIITATLVVTLVAWLALRRETPQACETRHAGSARATAETLPVQNPKSVSTKATKATGSTIQNSPVSVPVRIAALGNRPVPPENFSGEPWKLREEWRQLNISFLEIGNALQQGGALPSEIEFPLFDGATITLTHLKFVPQNAPHKGVFFARVKDDPVSHVMFSYVNRSTVGEIHIPSQNIQYEINNATPDNGPDSQIYLAQLDPAKLPVCGVCSQHPPAAAD